MFGMLEEVSKQQLYLVISFLYRFTSKGWPQVAFSWTKDYLWLLDTMVSEIWWGVHIISFHIINLLTPLLPTPWRSPVQTPPNHESRYFRHPHLLLKSLKSLTLSEKFSSPESIHTSSNTSWAVSYLSLYIQNRKGILLCSSNNVLLESNMADGARKCLCLIYKLVFLNVGLHTSSHQSTDFFGAWEARLHYISSARDLTVTL